MWASALLRQAGLPVPPHQLASDVDLSDTVSSTVTVVASDDTTGLGSNNTALLAMLTLNPVTGLAADTGTVSNLTWSFDSDTEFFDYLADIETLTLTYTVISADGNGGTDTQDVVMTITGTNDAPVIIVGSTPLDEVRSFPYHNHQIHQVQESAMPRIHEVAACQIDYKSEQWKRLTEIFRITVPSNIQDNQHEPLASEYYSGALRSIR